MSPPAERSRSFDDVSLVAGIGIALLGALLLAEQVGPLELGFGWLGSIVAAICGASLLLSGLRDARASTPVQGEPR